MKCGICKKETHLDGRIWKGYTVYCPKCAYNHPNGGYTETC